MLILYSDLIDKVEDFELLYDSFVKVYVCDFKILEDELLGTDKYVSIDKKNYKTFSSKYMQLFLSICSGIDSIAEEFCVALDEFNNVKNKRKSMIQRFLQIKKDYCENISNEVVEVNLVGYKVCIHPFSKFSEQSCGDWWQDYNQVKHLRSGAVESSNGNMFNYELANLKNVMHALSAYYLLISLINRFLTSNGEPVKSQMFSYK